MPMSQEERDALDAQWEAERPERELNQVRAERNQKIADTDWAVLVDSPLSETLQAEVKLYRQKLRDITDGFTTLEDLVWPVNPLD